MNVEFGQSLISLININRIEKQKLVSNTVHVHKAFPFITAFLSVQMLEYKNSQMYVLYRQWIFGITIESCIEVVINTMNTSSSQLARRSISRESFQSES